MTTRITPRGQVLLGDLPADFLRIQINSQQQQCLSDEQTAQLLQAQQSPGFSYVPGNVAGRLSITVSQAQLVKNYGITKMDPYCRLRIGNSIFETQTSHNGSKNPRWNKVVQCYLPVGVDSIYLEIFDEKTFQVDDRIAWAHITLPAAIFSGEQHEDWYPLTGKQGEEKEGVINLTFAFSPIEPTPAVGMPMYMPAAAAMMPQMVPQVVMVPATQVPGYYPAPAMMPSAMTPYGAPPVVAIQQTVPVPGTVPVATSAQRPPAARLPMFTEEDITQIKDMFPSMDRQVVKSVLEANRGDKNATINALLQMGD